MTCRLLDLAGRPTGVWQIWGAGEPRRWKAPVRMLCRIICQLSEVTSLLSLQQDQQALTPHLLDRDKVDYFYRVRAGLLRRPKQGLWSVPAVQAFAAQHLEVSIDQTVHVSEELAKVLRRDVAGDLAGSISRIRGSVLRQPIDVEGPIMKNEDRLRLVDLLAEQALGEKDYFRRLIQQADLTKTFKLQRQDGWSGQTKSDALNLVDWALKKGRNPADPKYTTLASILMPELSNLGFDDAATVVATISAYKLILDTTLLDSLRHRFQGHPPISHFSGPHEIRRFHRLDRRLTGRALKTPSNCNPGCSRALPISSISASYGMRFAALGQFASSMSKPQGPPEPAS